jgi:hypothetical protein
MNKFNFKKTKKIFDNKIEHFLNIKLFTSLETILLNDLSDFFDFEIYHALDFNIKPSIILTL